MKRREFLETLLLYIGSISFPWSRLLAQEFFYYAWSWGKWREITGARPEKYISDQAGRSELVDLLQLYGRPITTVQEWIVKREEIKKLLLQIMGEFPVLTTWLNPRTLEEKEFDNYIRRKIVYTSEPGDEVPAYLFIPRLKDKKFPAVLCPHQTNPYGKQEAAGIKGNPELALAVKLAERGYVTLAPDAICFGERHNPLLGHYGEAIEFYKKYPRWSVAGKMIWDKSRAIDYLWTLEEVDPERIGAIGHSHGAYGSLHASAFDDRIKAVVASCGFSLFRADGNTFRWSHATPVMPKLGFFMGEHYKKMTWENFQQFKLEEVNQVPFDWHYILALIAPRSLFLSVAVDDRIFPYGDRIEREVLPRLYPIYELYGKRDHLEAYFFKGGHRFPPEAQEKAFAWLDRWLG